MDQSNNNVDEKMKKSAQKYITYPLRGYLTQDAMDVIARLKAVGFDPDLAFAIAESALPEDEFYSLPNKKEDEC